MKSYYFILILLFLRNIFCENNSTNSTDTKTSSYEDKCTNKKTNSEDDCFNLLQDEEKENDFDCCLVKYKSGTQTFGYCYLLDNDEKEDYKKGLEDSGKEDVEVICSKTMSLKNYINLNLLFLILILL